MFKNPWVLVSDAASSGLNGLWLDADALMQRAQPVAGGVEGVGVGAQGEGVDSSLRTPAMAGKLCFSPAVSF